MYSKLLLGASLVVSASGLQLGVAVNPMVKPHMSYAHSIVMKADDTPSVMDKKEHLMGGAESLAECLYDADNPGDIEECRLDFEELIGMPTGACVETENGAKCNPEEIKVTNPTGEAKAGPRAGDAKMRMLVEPCPRFGPGKCIFRGDKCTGKRCKVNSAPCKVNHASV